ncbi:hypothetical protein D3C77_427910 [compost metagenome]
MRDSGYFVERRKEGFGAIQMTAVKLPGQMEVPLVVEHIQLRKTVYDRVVSEHSEYFNGRALAKLLRSYDESPTSQKWIDIQQLAREILK